ncbi:hypothetical protein GCM10009754_88130 [Amycolatopsis minnesotensis]|uniref:PPE domain-containing protein n=2 Tax=Amycolatopsis minnesotensis TaxID=337894 RepID=A0ABN2T049_9PSEU
MFPFDQLGEVARGVAHGLGEVARGFGDMLGEGLRLSTMAGVPIQAAPLPEVVEKLRNGRSQEWHDGAVAARGLADEHHQVSDDVNRLLTRLRASWTGRSAEAADARIDKFRAVASSAAERFGANASNLETTAGGFDHAQRNLEPMPPMPPEKNFWDTLVPWKTDVESQIDAYNATASRNLERYNTYASAAQASKSGLSGDYGVLGAYGGRDFAVAPPPTGPGGLGSHGGHGPVVKHPHEPGHAPGGSAGPGGPAGPGGGPVVVPGGGPGIGGGVVPPSGSSGGAMTGGGHDSGGGTSSASYVSPETAVGGSTAVPPGSGVSGSTINIGTGAGSGSGTGSGFGAGMIASPGSPVPGGGLGGATGGKPGEGRMTGAAPRSGGVPSEAGGVSARGGAGTRGVSGMGGLAPGGRGKEDDREHKRKYGVPEVDESVAEVDEATGKLIDPVTGLPVVPPTIGG